MPPRKPLQLRPVSPVSAAAPVEAKAAPEVMPKATRADRQDKKIIAGHFPKSIWKQFRNLCTTEEKTAQELLEEALTDLFLKYRS
jgi:hypothetical protein